jgi:hypothetical protein
MAPKPTGEVVMADVRRGIWKQPRARTVEPPPEEPTFHQFASEWIESRSGEFSTRTIEDYKLALTHHLLPFFAEHRLSEITAREVDRYIWRRRCATPRSADDAARLHGRHEHEATHSARWPLVRV